MVSTLLGALPGWGAAPALCQSQRSSIITAEDRCSKSGIDIHYSGEDGQTVACLKAKEVQANCGPDGLLTRQQAYRLWYGKLQEFQSTCMTQGGHFIFQDSDFVEPQNESFCMPAEPEIGTSMLEDTLCNFHSVCPAVTVLCQFDCASS